MKQVKPIHLSDAELGALLDMLLARIRIIKREVLAGANRKAQLRLLGALYECLTYVYVRDVYFPDPP